MLHVFALAASISATEPLGSAKCVLESHGDMEAMHHCMEASADTPQLKKVHRFGALCFALKRETASKGLFLRTAEVTDGKNTFTCDFRGEEKANPGGV